MSKEVREEGGRMNEGLGLDHQSGLHTEANLSEIPVVGLSLLPLREPPTLC